MPEGFQQIVPYAVNFSIVVVLLVFIARNPLKKYLYQRHERMRDFLEDSARVHAKSLERNKAVSAQLSSAEREMGRIVEREIAQAKQEAQEHVQKSHEEVERIEKEAQRLADTEGSESEGRVKSVFVDLVISQTEAALRQELKKDDHSAIIKRAQNSIEVSV